MKRYSLLLPTLLLLAVSACTKDELVPERTETTVTASGALARSAAGEVTVRVSAGAIPAGTQLSITTLRTGQPAGVVGPMFELDTEPRVSAFTGTVELEITNPQPSVEVVLANLDRTPTPVAGATYDAASARARGVLAHFSRYGLWTTTATLSCPSDQPVPGGACSGEAAECRYGEECCCGSCYPSLSCSCVSGQWACLHTDACLGAAQCPDAGVMDSGTSTITPTDGGVLDAGHLDDRRALPQRGRGDRRELQLDRSDLRVRPGVLLRPELPGLALHVRRDLVLLLQHRRLPGAPVQHTARERAERHARHGR
jgi:hypothetical protein